MLNECNKNLHQADKQAEGEGAQTEPTEVKSFWFTQPIEPVSQEHQQFLAELVKATRTDVNSQQ